MKISVRNEPPTIQQVAIIESGELDFARLVRLLRRIPETTVTGVSRDLMTDDARADIVYRGLKLRLDAVFSDLWIECDQPSPLFDDLVSILRSHRVRWWERWL
jgi:hypothetical protein